MLLKSPHPIIIFTAQCYITIKYFIIWLKYYLFRKLKITLPLKKNTLGIKSHCYVKIEIQYNVIMYYLWNEKKWIKDQIVA